MLTFDTFYPSDQHLTDSTLLLNIETTGLSPKSAFVCMIGLGWPENGGWHFRLLLAQKRMEERQMMMAFQSILQNFNQILTYGGDSFSYRFLEARWMNYADTDPSSLFQNMRQLDIQKDIHAYRQLLSMKDVKKSSAEQWIGYVRKEHLSPKALIECYSTWEISQEASLLSQLIAHHEADMVGLLTLYAFTAYAQFFKGQFTHVTHCHCHEGHCHLTVQLSMPVPQPVSLENDTLSLTLNKQEAQLDIPLFDGELKYFLPGPVKDYYYLPKEDQAVHRSVACYVDKSYRQKATAATCYIRQSGLFLPVADTSFQPCFQQNYKGKQTYILYDSDRFETQPDLLDHVIALLIKKNVATLLPKQK